VNPIERLTELFEKFPGIGPRQARRFVQYLLSEHPAYRGNLSDTIRLLGSQTSQCKKCFRWFVKNADKTSLCNICSNPSRDQSVLFVVEKDADVDNVERSGFKGLYFVLGGTIPLAAENIEKFIRIRELLKRVEGDATQSDKDNEAFWDKNSSTAHTLQEIILGLSATTEGDHTRLIIQEKLLPIAAGFGFKISSLGRGLSTGSELEYADPDTISSALNSRG
jgi:recombination protein RecR